MKLNELLEEVKIGSENYKRIKRLEEDDRKKNESLKRIKETPEENKISYLLKSSLENLQENEEIMKYISQAYTQIKSYEEKKREVSELRESYSRMKFDSIKETFISLIEAVNMYEIKNKNLLSNTLALVQYTFEELAEKTQREINLPSLVIQEQMEEELKIIKENI